MPYADLSGLLVLLQDPRWAKYDLFPGDTTFFNYVSFLDKVGNRFEREVQFDGLIPLVVDNPSISSILSAYERELKSDIKSDLNIALASSSNLMLRELNWYMRRGDYTDEVRVTPYDITVRYAGKEPPEFLSRITGKALSVPLTIVRNPESPVPGLRIISLPQKG